MFGKKARKKFQEDLASQSAQSNQMLQQALTKPPSALETAKEKEQTDWLQQTNSPDFDVTKTTGMSPYMNLYNRAKSNNLADETPLPTGASWGGSTNTALREALSSQGSRQREQEAAGGLQDAFAAKNASIRGDTQPFLNYQQQRNLSLWDVLNNRSMGLSGMYQKQINMPSFLSQYLIAGASGMGQAARSGAP